MRNTELAKNNDSLSFDNEEYLNPNVLAHFEKKLRQWRLELVGVALSAKNDLKETCFGVPDLYDVATAQAEINVEVEGLKRHRVQLAMIDNALSRIKDGSYGYCEISGERIGLKRLEIQPTATLSVEAQEMVERAERGAKYSSIDKPAYRS